jgi:hypothetical protein
MRELFDGNVVVYERAEKILALSYHHVAVAARRNDSSYFRIGNGSVHLHDFLERGDNPPSLGDLSKARRWRGPKF